MPNTMALMSMTNVALHRLLAAARSAGPRRSTRTRPSSPPPSGTSARQPGDAHEGDGERGDVDPERRGQRQLAMTTPGDRRSDDEADLVDRLVQRRRRRELLAAARGSARRRPGSGRRCPRARRRAPSTRRSATPSARPALALTASPTLHTASAAWVTSSSRRRSMASASEPPTQRADDQQAGSCGQRQQADLRTTSRSAGRAGTPTATTVSWLPRNVMSWPVHSSRYCAAAPGAA